MARAHNLEFPVLSDPGNDVAGRFGLRYTFPEYLREIYLQLDLDIPRFNGDESWVLPLPARYIIDREGKIRHAEVSADYTRRPEPAATVEALKSLER